MNTEGTEDAKVVKGKGQNTDRTDFTDRTEKTIFGFAIPNFRSSEIIRLYCRSECSGLPPHQLVRL